MSIEDSRLFRKVVQEWRRNPNRYDVRTKVATTEEELTAQLRYLEGFPEAQREARRVFYRRRYRAAAS
jgi:hypothetical protein